MRLEGENEVSDDPLEAGRNPTADLDLDHVDEGLRMSWQGGCTHNGHVTHVAAYNGRLLAVKPLVGDFQETHDGHHFQLTRKIKKHIKVSRRRSSSHTSSSWWWILAPA